MKDAFIRPLVAKVSVSLLACLSLFLVLEFAVATLFVASDGVSVSLASKRWFERYWKPINSLGYRDVEHDEELLRQSRLVVVVGDSFVAGHGIKDIADRFQNVLAGRLGAEWAVVTLAENGWQTDDQLAALTAYPLIPEVLVLSYYFNDIDGAAGSLGYRRPRLVRMPPAPIRWAVDNSALLNWMYWQMNRATAGDEYMKYLDDWFANAEIWERHKLELLRFVGYARQNGVRLVCVVWPNLPDVSLSDGITFKVEGLFESQDVATVSVGEHLAGWKPSEMIVNGRDAHPSTRVHGTVAAALYAELRRPARCCTRDSRE